MKHSGWRRRLLRAGTPLWFALMAGVGLAHCKKPQTTSTAGPSGSSSATASTDSGPCTTYANRLCEKAGPDSSTCQAIKVATDLMPPEACTTGLKNVDYTAKKL